MAKEKKEETLTKKEKNKLKESILEEIETDVKSDIVSSVVEDVKKSFDREYKEEIKQELTKEVKEDIKENFRKEQNRLLRQKNFKIVRLTLYIIVLLAGSLYAIYCLYKTDQLEVLKNPKAYTPSTTMTTTTTTELVKDLNWYKKEYGYILEPIKITNTSLYKGNYKVNQLEMKEKLAIAYQVLDKDSIETEGVIRTIKDADMVEAYQKVFGTKEDYKSVRFTVEGMDYVYRSQYGEYISVDKEEKTEEIVQKIVDIKEEENDLYFTTIVGTLKDEHLYNIIENRVIAEKGSESDLEKYEKDLSKMEYHFTKEGDTYYLSEWTGK